MENSKKDLFFKYLTDQCTVDEVKHLLQEFDDTHHEVKLKTFIETSLKEDFPAENIPNEHLDNLYDAIQQQIVLQSIPKPSFYFRNIIRYSAAAILLFALSIVFYLQWQNKIVPKNLPKFHSADLTTISPGGNKAVLILEDGSSLSLTDADNGKLVKQAGIQLKKLQQGQLAYEKGQDLATNTPPTFNTIKTPIGGTYQVNLSDGSKVWLNANSSLRYPVGFANDTRVVELTGEGYFQIARETDRPFKVITQCRGIKQEVQVLGTHFNINAYAEEDDIRTTLLEGSVKISLNNEFHILKPNQQAIAKDHIAVNYINSKTVVDWKNGDFYFVDEPIKNIMRKLARWYNFEVEYEGDLPQEGFSAAFSRNKDLSAILTAFERTGRIHFKIEGRRIKVMR